MSDPIRPTQPHERSLAELAQRRTDLIIQDLRSGRDRLELLAVEESIRRVVSNRGLGIYDARQAGATWAQICEALDVDPAVAKADLAVWIDGQVWLYDYMAAKGERPFGLSPEQRVAVRGLLDAGDES